MGILTALAKQNGQQHENACTSKLRDRKQTKTKNKHAGVGGWFLHPTSPWSCTCACGRPPPPHPCSRTPSASSPPVNTIKNSVFVAKKGGGMWMVLMLRRRRIRRPNSKLFFLEFCAGGGCKYGKWVEFTCGYHGLSKWAATSTIDDAILRYDMS